VRRIVKAIGVTAVSVGTLILVSQEALSWWSWQAFLESLGPDTVGSVIVDPPPPGPAEAAVRYVVAFLALCLVGAAFAAAVVWPVTNAARRIFSHPFAGHVMAGVVVAALSGLAFAAQTSPSGPWHPAVVFAIGGAIGVVATTAFTLMLPPNTSLERTREG
jgi:hypothetical protein